MALLLSGPAAPVTLPEQETALAKASSETLSHFVQGSSHGTDAAPLSLRLTNPATGDTMEAHVPAVAVRLLADVLAKLAEGQAVTLLPLHAELSTQQAADLLGVSRPYFVKLLEQGKIPHRKVGEQRRVRYAHLLRYLELERHEAGQALDELVAVSEEMGLYEMERTGILKNPGEEQVTGTIGKGAKQQRERP